MDCETSNFPHFPCKKDPLLHIHAQYEQHDEAWLLGTRAAFLRLRDTLNQLLEGKGTADSNGAETLAAGFWARDGEGFNVMLVLDENETRWNKSLPGYHAEYLSEAVNKSEHPSKHITPETYKKEFERGCGDLK